MERGRWVDVGAEGLYDTHVQLPVSFQQHDKRGAPVVMGAGKLQEKFACGPRPETVKMIHQPVKSGLMYRPVYGLVSTPGMAAGAVGGGVRRRAIADAGSTVYRGHDSGFSDLGFAL